MNLGFGIESSKWNICIKKGGEKNVCCLFNNREFNDFEHCNLLYF